MAQKLLRFYELIKADGGVQGQMRLAMKTAISGTKAATEPDSPENFAKFKTAYKEITGKDAQI
jgi:hypothetical protein